MSHISKGDVHAYLDGALGAYPEEAARHVRDHLDACPECSELLEGERRLRQEASTILADSAQGPVELDPLEELLARAAASETQEGSDPEGSQGMVGSERTVRARPSLGRRTYALRWVATIVISLGSGWMARELTGPAGDVARGVDAEPFVTELGVRQDQQVLERDQQALERDNAGRIAEAESPRESLTAEAADATEAAGAVGAVGAVGGDADRGALGFDDDAVLDQVREVPARQRDQSAVARGVGPADASATGQPTDGRVEATPLFDELRRSAPTPAPAQDRPAVSALAEIAPPPLASSAALSTTPFLVPGLPVRDVWLALEADGLTGGLGGSVVVTQELADGRVVELEFVPLAESDPRRRDARQERSEILDRTRPEGWGMAVRDVPGGVAVLSGPLTERELMELLDLALGPR